MTRSVSALSTVEGFSPGIHGARGIFAFAVVVFHVTNSGLPVWKLPFLVVEFFDSLKYGVELFFAISGFVIAGTMSRSRTPFHFLMNRATRVFPVLWAVLIVFVPIAIFADLERVRDYVGPELFFIFIGNMLALGPLFPVPVLYGVAWTLGYEFVFYYLCFAYLSIKRWLGWNPLILVVVAGLAICVFYPRALFFLPGVIVAAGLLKRPWFDRLAGAPLLMVLVFLACWQTLANESSPFFNPVYQWTPVQVLLGVVAFGSCTLAVHGIAHGRGLFGRFLQTAPILWLGTISYSLYLWHPLILGIVKAGMYKVGLPRMVGEWSQLVFFCLAVPPSLLVAHISQLTLERAVTMRLRAWTR